MPIFSTLSKKECNGHLAIFSANLIYGANYTIAKMVMPIYIKPLGFVALRVIGALILFWVVGLFFPQNIEKKDFKLLALCGLFGVALNQLFFFAGLNLTTPINAAIIMITAPIIVMIISAFVLNDKITKSKVGGIILGLSGAASLILIGKTTNFGSNTSLGDLFILLNACFFAIYLVLTKKLIHKYSVLTISKWIFLFGSIIVIPFGFQELKEVRWELFTTKIWLSVFFVIFAVTFLAYLFNNFGLQSLSPNIVGFYIYLQPFLAASIAIWLGTDAIDMIKIFAAILIFSGIYLISKKNLKP